MAKVKTTSLKGAWISRVRRWLDRASLPEPLVFGAAAIGVGLLSGIGVWLFKQLIDGVRTIMFTGLGGWLAPAGKWTIALLPVLGGLLVGLVSQYLIGKERYHGLPAIIEACALAAGRLPYLKMPVRVATSALSIGSGASVGPEDPSVQIGANLGSMVGQWLHLSEDRMRALVAGGAAAGISAAFNAPIAGVFFALEVVLGELNSSSFGFAAISAVISAVFTQAVSGAQPAFNIPQYSLRTIWELPLYLVLGLLAGPLAAAYIRLVFLSHKIFHGLPLPGWSKPAVAGLLIGLAGIALPQILGVGYETIGAILANNPFPTSLLLLLLIAKLIATPISVGGGFIGGVFAPSLFLGAVLGGTFGQIAGHLFPGLGLSIPAYARVGMAAMLAGAIHAPLTAVLLLFEMTHDYRIILPVMFAVAVSLSVSRRLQKDSIYLHALALNGIHLQGGRDIEVLESIQVQEVMNTDLAHLNETDLAATAMEVLSATHHHGLPVFDAQGDLVGMLTLQDLGKVSGAEVSRDLTVGSLCTRELVTAFPEESIDVVLRRMSARDFGRIPVVSSDHPTRLVGMLRRSDIIRAYELALVRRTALRHRSQQVRLGILGGLEVQEMTIEAGSPWANKRIKEVVWPRSCVISSIRRGRQVILPHGDTLLLPGDVLVVVAEEKGSGKPA